MQRRLFICLTWIALLVFMLAAAAQAEVKPGDKLGDLQFPAPLSPEQAKYFGKQRGVEQLSLEVGEGGGIRFSWS